ncbi:MAG: Mov34/MPN/PAD-1 family protein [Saprospiraceae bacterium]
MAFIVCIRQLHQNDQPLEPFILSANGAIVIPENIRNGEILSVTVRSETKYQINLEVQNGEMNSGGKFYAKLFESKPRLHGIVNRIPQTLYDLINLFSGLELDLVSSFKEFVLDERFRELFPIIILSVPTQRELGTEVESIQRFAFWCHKSTKEIGILISLLGVHDNIVSPLLLAEPNLEESTKVPVWMLLPYSCYSQKLAKTLSQTNTSAGYGSILQIGVGAIGSGVFNTLARSGFGNSWSIVDDDILLPHNLYRHTLSNFHIGYFKSHAISFTANQILDNPTFSVPFVEKFGISTISNELKERLLNSDLIIDTSASLSVSRALSKIEGVHGRAISVFLNPKGNDLVIMAEDSEKSTKLGELEMLYYKFLCQETRLENHFEFDSGRVRYGNSCRDISNNIPNEYFGIFSSIASGVIKQLYSETNAFVRIWHLNEDMSISHFFIPTSPFVKTETGDWIILISSDLHEKIHKQRAIKLPSETGGILIGSFDMQSKIIYIVDSIFSPNDSKEYPTAYYRGINGLKDRLEHIEKCTDNHLLYIGEWHSHPNKCSTKQSCDDLILFKWIKDFMQPRGFPGLMVIVGDSQLEVYVG